MWRIDRRTDRQTSRYAYVSLVKTKCIGDDTKAAARQSQNCIKKTKKIKYGDKRFSIWRMEFLHPAMWHDNDIGMWVWDHDSEFIRWQ